VIRSAPVGPAFKKILVEVPESASTYIMFSALMIKSPLSKPEADESSEMYFAIILIFDFC
jgi:hypothetical protein